MVWVLLLGAALTLLGWALVRAGRRGSEMQSELFEEHLRQRGHRE